MDGGPFRARRRNRLPDRGAAGREPTSLVLRLTPPAALPFVQLARLDRPIGWQLLLAPCWQSAALAGLAGGVGPDLVHLALFLIGAIAMRGAGSTYNDILDRKLDAGVERTRGRPCLPGASACAPPRFFWFAGVGRARRSPRFNRFAIFVGLGSLAIVARLSPDEARHRMAAGGAGSRLLLGGVDGLGGALWRFGGRRLCFSTPRPSAGRSATTRSMRLQDARDDAIVGIRSTARLFGAQVRLGVGLFYLGAALFAQRRCSPGAARIIAADRPVPLLPASGWQLRRIEGATPEWRCAVFRPIATPA